MKNMLQATSKAFTFVLILLVLHSCKTLQQQSQSSAPPSMPSPTSSPSTMPSVPSPSPSPSMPSPSTANIPSPSLPSTDSAGKQGDQRASNEPSSTASAEKSAPDATSSSPAAREAAEILQTASQQAQQAADNLPPELPVTDEQQAGEGEWDPLLIEEESSSSASASESEASETTAEASQAAEPSSSASQAQDSRAAEILDDVAEVLAEASEAVQQGEANVAAVLADARIQVMVAQSQIPSLPQAQMEVLAQVLGDLDQSILLAGEVLVAGNVDFPQGSEGEEGNGSRGSGNASDIFDESLVIFDGEIAKVREETIEGVRVNVGTIGIPAIPSTAGTGEDSDDERAGDPEGENGTPIDIAGTGTALPPDPNDIPDGRDDDIVARQLRELAESETDPELKAKYWEEYKKYKAGVN